MAKIGGRSAWLAWPVGVICAGVVVALLVLAVPAIPATVDFVGTTLRGGEAARAAGAAEAERRAAAAEAATDCRSLYPDRLWSELTWTPGVLLSQDASASAGGDALAAALTPAVRFSCTWRTEDGRSARSTVSTVSPDGAAVAEAALAAGGFACTTEGDRLHCTRSADGVTEIHDLRGDVWLASALTGWAPTSYAELTASRAFP